MTDWNRFSNPLVLVWAGSAFQKGDILTVDGNTAEVIQASSSKLLIEWRDGFNENEQDTVVLEASGWRLRGKPVRVVMMIKPPPQPYLMNPRGAR